MRIARITRLIREPVTHSLNFICNVGAGYDTIDVVTSAKLGIYLSNTPGAVDAVSIWLITLNRNV